MSYLEEVLPEFRKGAKIRLPLWDKGQYLCYDTKTKNIVNDKGEDIDIMGCHLSSDQWEFYQEPEPDWNYIIKNKCLCLFWDYNESKKHIGILKSINKYETYKFSIVTPDNYVNDVSFVNCRPVHREVLCARSGI